MSVKGKRREVRVSAEDDDLLVEASGLAGVSVTEFLLDRALSDAEEIVRAHHSVVLDAHSYNRFLEALDRPVEPIVELADQQRKSRRLKRAD